MGRLAIRLDDITPDMNWENFFRLKKLFDQYDIKPLIGVVPDNRDPKLSIGEAREDFWELMRTLAYEDWTIAQHGYTHVYETTDSGILGVKEASEFAGIPYDEQYERIRKGRKILEENGLVCDVFMAPGHTYDENTLLALEQLKFHYVTDGYAEVPYYWKNLGFLPCTISTPKEPKRFDTLCLHLNTMTEEAFKNLEAFLENYYYLVMDYMDVLDDRYFRPRGRKIAMQEKRALRKRLRIIRYQKSQVYMDFMVRTNSSHKIVKTGKRLVGWPFMYLRMKRELRRNR